MRHRSTTATTVNSLRTMRRDSWRAFQAAEHVSAGISPYLKMRPDGKVRPKGTQRDALADESMEHSLDQERDQQEVEQGRAIGGQKMIYRLLSKNGTIICVTTSHLGNDVLFACKASASVEHTKGE